MKFAKIFERDNDQVVVMKGNSDDSNPSLKIMFRVKAVGFATAELEYSNFVERDDAYEQITEDTAFGIANEYQAELSPCIQ